MRLYQYFLILMCFFLSLSCVVKQDSKNQEKESLNSFSFLVDSAYWVAFDADETTIAQNNFSLMFQNLVPAFLLDRSYAGLSDDMLQIGSLRFDSLLDRDAQIEHLFQQFSEKSQSNNADLVDYQRISNADTMELFLLRSMIHQMHLLKIVYLNPENGSAIFMIIYTPSSSLSEQVVSQYSVLIDSVVPIK